MDRPDDRIRSAAEVAVSAAITRLIEGGIVDVTTHPVCDKPLIERWVDRRIALLGKAAHKLAPMNGQGANQAIQDGDSVATALDGHYLDDLMPALAA